MSDSLPPLQPALPVSDSPSLLIGVFHGLRGRLYSVGVRFLALPVIRDVYARLKASALFRLIFLVWIGLTLFCIGMAYQIYSAIPYSIRVTIDRPTAIPSRFSDGRNFAAMKSVFAPLSGKVFHPIITGKHVNEETGDIIDVKVQKNPFFSCERISRDSVVISAETVNYASVGDVCVEVDEEDGEEVQVYSWLKGSMFYRISFSKDLLNDEEKNALLQSIEPVEVDITCISKLFCFLTDRGLVRWE